MTTYTDGYGLVHEDAPIVLVDKLSELDWLVEVVADAECETTK